ncbi:hypothetical protein L210DRAFT_867479 [Boletus edulis BED1]|uniref:Uncharacterized protein n=1 Tax=Boletus edulis BED1 TaxID=1328754 RepID=A0AAD4BTH3_BOLED|nr:hypothetical protein L210DRAFT_867479 [Boletus edulis BED1]
MSVQKFAINVAYRLSSLRNFLEASQELCHYSEQLTDADIQCHARKLLALMEVARTTLNRAGVKLHLFTSCPPKYQPYKSAYFRLLVLIIRQNQDQFPTELQGKGRRVDRLLLPLTTQLVIWRSHDPYAQLGIADLMKNINSRSRPQREPPQLEQPGRTAVSLRVPPWPLNDIAASMPPPDAFPPKVTEDKRRKRSLLDLVARRSRPVHKQHPPRPELETKPLPDEDDELISPRLLTRMRRHFGIFCTGNKRPSQQLSR